MTFKFCHASSVSQGLSTGFWLLNSSVFQVVPSKFCLWDFVFPKFAFRVCLLYCQNHIRVTYWPYSSMFPDRSLVFFRLDPCSSSLVLSTIYFQHIGPYPVHSPFFEHALFHHCSSFPCFCILCFGIRRVVHISKQDHRGAFLCNYPLPGGGLVWFKRHTLIVLMNIFMCSLMSVRLLLWVVMFSGTFHAFRLLMAHSKHYSCTW